MGKVINLANMNDWGEKLENVRFNKRKLIIITEEGQREEYMFIVLENIKNYKMKVTGYSKYFFEKLTNSRIETLDYHAKVIVSFLNYVFIDNYNEYKIDNITDLKILHGDNYLRDCSKGKIGRPNKTKKTVQKIEDVLNKFYRFLYEECLDMKYFEEKKFGSRESEDKKSYKIKKNRKEEKTKDKSLFKVSYPNHIPPLRIKNLSAYLLSEIMKVCDIYYPELKLAICLQAFGGLRRGEVCNVRKDIIDFVKVIEEFTWLTVDLREKIQMRSDGGSVGNIKKRRIQPIHPIFLPILTNVYERHMELIKNRNNKYGAIFLNRDGEAMTDESYEQKFERIIKLVIRRLSKKGGFDSNNEINILLSGKINTHVFRHFFTKFISKLESTRNPCEIAYWRGDSSLQSALAYLMGSPVIDEKIKIIQAETLKDLQV